MLKIMVMGIGDIMNDVMNGLFAKNTQENIDLVLIEYEKSSFKKSDLSNVIYLETGTRYLTPSPVPALGEEWLNDENNRQKIRQYLDNVDLLFIVGNMGGNLGIIGTSELAKLAKEFGVFTMSIALKPFTFEGSKRNNYFNQYLPTLKQYSDSTLVVPCDDIQQRLAEKVSMKEMFQVSIPDYVGKIIDTFYHLVNNDNAFIPLEAVDFQEVFSKHCYVVIGQGVATGENAGEVAVNLALQDNTLKRLAVKDTQDCVVYISTKESVFNLEQFQSISNMIMDYYSNDSDMFFSVVFNETQQHDIELMIFATSAEYYDSQIEN